MKNSIFSTAKTIFKPKNQSGKIEELDIEQNDIAIEIEQLRSEIKAFYLEHPDKDPAMPDKIYVKDMNELEEKITEHIPKKVVEDEIVIKNIIEQDEVGGSSPLDFSRMKEFTLPEEYRSQVFSPNVEEVPNAPESAAATGSVDARADREQMKDFFTMDKGGYGEIVEAEVFDGAKGIDSLNELVSELDNQAYGADNQGGELDNQDLESVKESLSRELLEQFQEMGRQETTEDGLTNRIFLNQQGEADKSSEGFNQNGMSEKGASNADNKKASGEKQEKDQESMSDLLSKLLMEGKLEADIHKEGQNRGDSSIFQLPIHDADGKDMEGPGLEGQGNQEDNNENDVNIDNDESINDMDDAAETEENAIHDNSLSDLLNSLLGDQKEKQNSDNQSEEEEKQDYRSRVFISANMQEKKKHGKEKTTIEDHREEESDSNDEKNLEDELIIQNFDAEDGERIPINFYDGVDGDEENEEETEAQNESDQGNSNGIMRNKMEKTKDAGQLEEASDSSEVEQEKEARRSKEAGRGKEDDEENGRGESEEGIQFHNAEGQSLEEGQFQGVSRASGEGEPQGVSSSSDEGETQGVSRASNEGEIQGVSSSSDEGETQGVSRFSDEGEIQGVSRASDEGDPQGVSRASDEGELQGVSRASDEEETQGVSRASDEGDPQGVSRASDEGESQGVSRASDEGEAQGVSRAYDEGESLGGSQRSEAGQFEGVYRSSEDEKSMEESRSSDMGQFEGGSRFFEEETPQKWSQFSKGEQSEEVSQSPGVGQTEEVSQSSGVGESDEVSLTFEEVVSQEEGQSSGVGQTNEESRTYDKGESQGVGKSSEGEQSNVVVQFLEGGQPEVVSGLDESRASEDGEQSAESGQYGDVNQSYGAGESESASQSEDMSHTQKEGAFTAARNTEDAIHTDGAGQSKVPSQIKEQSQSKDFTSNINGSNFKNLNSELGRNKEKEAIERVGSKEQIIDIPPNYPPVYTENFDDNINTQVDLMNNVENASNTLETSNKSVDSNIFDILENLMLPNPEDEKDMPELQEKKTAVIQGKKNKKTEKEVKKTIGQKGINKKFPQFKKGTAADKREVKVQTKEETPTDIKTSADLKENSQLKSGAVLKANAENKAGSALKAGSAIKSRTDMESGSGIKSKSEVKPGFEIKSGATLKEGSGIKSRTEIKAGAEIKSRVDLKAGSGIKTEAEIKAGSESNLETETNAGSNTRLKTTLNSDVQVKAAEVGLRGKGKIKEPGTALAEIKKQTLFSRLLQKLRNLFKKKPKMEVVQKAPVTEEIEDHGSHDRETFINGLITGSVSGENVTLNPLAVIKKDVNATGRVLCMPGSAIMGKVKCESIIVEGTVFGEIDAQDKVVIKNDALVMGDIYSSEVKIAQGAMVQGNLFFKRTGKGDR